MKICIAGWYLDKKFLKACYAVKSKYRPTIVSHRPSNTSIHKYSNLDTRVIPNIGLEFGCYDYYLKNVWDHESNVFFTHDDAVVDPKVFDEIAKIKHDCAYVFRDEAEDRSNGGKHGRAIFCSAKFLELILNYECDCYQSKDREDKHHNHGAVIKGSGVHTGFWFDPENSGHISGKPEVGRRHYNDGIYHFHWLLGRIRDGKCGNKKGSLDVVNRVYFSEFNAGRRGTWKHVEREKAKWERDKNE